MTLAVPRVLAEEWSTEPEWLAALPDVVAACVEAWSLDLEEPFHSPRALVVPAGEVVLKVNAPSHFEADHEADALAAWDGRGAVELRARDDERRALLLERCTPGTPLALASPEAIDVVCSHLERLAVRADESSAFRRLADEAERWSHAVTERYEQGGAPFDRRLLDAAVDTFRTVDRRPSWLVNQDLHGENVLRATREPWLVIDPKPLVGERELDGVGLLRNAAADAGVGGVRRWLDALTELGLDRDRMRAWAVAHTLAWSWDRTGDWSRGSVEIAQTIASS